MMIAARRNLRLRVPELNWLAWVAFVCAFAKVVVCAAAAELSVPVPTKNVAAIVTVYRHNSHADVIVSRLLQTETLDGKGKDSPLKLDLLHTDHLPSDDL